MENFIILKTNHITYNITEVCFIAINTHAGLKRAHRVHTEIIIDKNLIVSKSNRVALSRQ